MELRKKILTLQERLKNNKFKEVIEEANLLKQNIKITETDIRLNSRLLDQFQSE